MWAYRQHQGDKIQDTVEKRTHGEMKVTLKLVYSFLSICYHEHIYHIADFVFINVI